MLFLISISAVSANDVSNDTLTVESDMEVISDTLSTYTDLSGEISNTPAGGELKLNNSYSYDSTADSSVSARYITINKAITVDGQGNTIDGNNQKAAFSITKSNVILKNIVFKNTYSTTNGGALSITNSAKNISIINCTFENSYSATNGGAVYVYSANNVTFSDCTFINNTAASYGGAVRTASSYNVDYVHSVFKNNTAKNGGAISHNFVEGETITESEFYNNTAIYGNGGAFTRESSSNKLLIAYSVFEDNKVIGLEEKTTTGTRVTGGKGGAVYLNGYGDILNSTFRRNNATYDGGAICRGTVISETGNLVDCIFEENTASNGGAIFWALAKSSNITNCVFTHNSAKSGGAGYIAGNHVLGTTLSDSTFTDNFADTDGGALYWGNYNGSVLNSNFKNNSANSKGGSIFWQQREGLIDNCTFEDSKAATGGTIFFTGFVKTIKSNGVISKCEFRNSSANDGGIIRIESLTNMDIINCSFKDAKASSTGGAISVYSADDVKIKESSFENLTANNGGAVYAFSSSNLGIENSAFENLKASSNGGAIYVYLKSVIIKSSSIKNATANNGGAIYFNSLNDGVQIDDVEFIKNTAKSYGGAIYSYIGSYNVTASSFTDNIARYGGAIIMMGNKFNVTESTFIGNNASAGSAIYKSNSAISYLNNNNFVYNQAYSSSLTISRDYRNVTATLRGFDNILNAIWNSDKLESVFIDGTNPVNGAENSNNGKLVYQDSREYNQDIIVTILDENNNMVSNKTYKTDIYGNVNLIVGEGKKVVFTHQNDVFYTSITNSTVVPDVIVIGENKTTYVNNYITIPVHIFDENNVNMTNGTVTLVLDDKTGTADVNNGIAYIQIQAPATGGLFKTNITFTDQYGLNFTNNSYVWVWNPSFEVAKYTINETVIVGEKVRFKITVKNTGNMNLTDVFIKEDSFTGLTYDSFDDSGIWDYSNNIWTLKHNLTVGEEVSLYVTFNTTVSGTFTNNAVAGAFNLTDKKTANKTKVLNPKLNAEKITLTPAVIVNNQAEFEITLINTGDADLTGVYILEDEYDGLIYDSYTESPLWSHSIVNGKNRWDLNGKLTPNEIISLFVKFNTTEVGTFTNTAIVGSDLTENAYVSNETTVLKSELQAVKITLTPNVKIGDDVEFEIILNNTGDADLSGVFVSEEEFDGLEYKSYMESPLWNHKIINGKHTWILNDNLVPNEIVSLFIYFNTVSAGSLTNIAVVGSDLTENQSVHADVNVLEPGIDVKKITLTPIVAVGDIAEFEIIINNTGEVALKGVNVTEEDFEGLLFDSYTESPLWTHSIVGGKHVWSLNDDLNVHEFVSLFVFFKTADTGIFNNTVVVKSREHHDVVAHDSVEVLLPTMEVEKVTLTPVVAIGDQAIFEIVIHNNNSLFDLSNVFVIEDSYDGLIFDSNWNDDLWVHEIVNGKHKWTLNKDLPAEGTVGLFVVFNTTKLGNFTNFATVGSSNTLNKTVNATVEVNYTASEEGNNPLMNVSITTLHPLVVIGNQTMFEILVHNVGDTVLHDVTIKEFSFDGLIFDHFIDHTGFWNPLSNTLTSREDVLMATNDDLGWKMNVPLYVGEYLGFFVVFNTTSTGRFTNTIVGNSDQTEEQYDSDIVDVIKPEFDVIKVALNETVGVGEQVTFEIIVHNTGQVDLTNLTIYENPDSGLVFDHFINNNNLWIKDGLTWKLNSTLLVGEFVNLMIVFNTTSEGNFTNAVVANANSSDDKKANSTVEVFNQEFEVEKVLLNQTVIAVGDEVHFEIIVENTGKVSIHDLTVEENPDEKLEYVNFINNSNLWIKDGLTWKLNSTLLPKEIVNLILIFKVTDEGNLTNIVNVGDKSANASVEVFKPEYEITKVAINDTVTVGDEVTFEIIAHNTGKLPIDNIVISENPSEALVYDHYTDNLNMWINNGLSWSLNTSLKPGEYVGFFIVFKTVKTGNLTNTIVSGNKTADATVNVLENITNQTPIDNHTVNETVENHTDENITVNETVENHTSIDVIVPADEPEDNEATVGSSTFEKPVESIKHKIDSKATGNPLLVLLVVLLNLVILRKRD